MHAEFHGSCLVLSPSMRVIHFPCAEQGWTSHSCWPWHWPGSHRPVSFTTRRVYTHVTRAIEVPRAACKQKSWVSIKKAFWSKKLFGRSHSWTTSKKCIFHFFFTYHVLFSFFKCIIRTASFSCTNAIFLRKSQSSKRSCAEEIREISSIDFVFLGIGTSGERARTNQSPQQNCHRY